VNQDREDLDIAELLSAVGQVRPPTSDALADAREELWSAVADEMLCANDPRTRTVERTADQPQQTARQRRSNRSKQTDQRRKADPGA
jgi:hypothetical protein